MVEFMQQIWNQYAETVQEVEAEKSCTIIVCFPIDSWVPEDTSEQRYQPVQTCAHGYMVPKIASRTGFIRMLISFEFVSSCTSQSCAVASGGRSDDSSISLLYLVSE
ncbi:hypothetical protein OPV22_011346 [Ensete ventricosum]|uniref:Uncharacterized protein n=1 Tax=Ensete ventricosum TaxID=4639 RepID=A0AAV8RF40_ENSVE|nr:hypothetical protein OPV22_011346 [Ensete ventricosum]